jgi:single-stranded-DNA-specific exonuclease
VYPNPEKINGAIAWQTLVGIAKYLSRTGKEIKRSQLITKLGIEDQRILRIGFETLQLHGYYLHFVNDEFENLNQTIRISLNSLTDNNGSSNALFDPLQMAQKFIQATNEVIFQQQFFDRQFSNLLPSQ